MIKTCSAVTIVASIFLLVVGGSSPSFCNAEKSDIPHRYQEIGKRRKLADSENKCQSSSCYSNDETSIVVQQEEEETITGEVEEVGTFFFIEFATLQATLENFDKASSTDLIEAYNELVQTYCNDPYELKLDEIVILQSQVTTVTETETETAEEGNDGNTRKRQLRQGGLQQQQRGLQMSRNRASGFLQGFGVCGRACPADQRLFDDVTSRRLQDEEKANSKEEEQHQLRANKRSLNEGDIATPRYFTNNSKDLNSNICRGNYPTEEEMIAYFTEFLATRRTYQNILDVTAIEELDEAPVLQKVSKCSKSGKKKKGKKSRKCESDDDHSGDP